MPPKNDIFVFASCPSVGFASKGSSAKQIVHDSKQHLKAKGPPAAPTGAHIFVFVGHLQSSHEGGKTVPCAAGYAPGLRPRPNTPGYPSGPEDLRTPALVRGVCSLPACYEARLQKIVG